ASCDLDAPSDPKAPALGDLIAPRRGPLGDLLASRSNLEVPLPMIDLVNECLEHLAAPSGGAAGAVYDTAADASAELLAALPEHSSPAVPVALPDAYTTLASDFSAPILPYGQALDIDRTYACALGTTRFSLMRHFRRDITEFVLDPSATEPADFQRHLWRYPVRIDAAREYLHISPEEYDLLFTKTPDDAMLAALFGYGKDDSQDIFVVSVFLERTGLSYCEFIDLWRSGFVPFQRGVNRGENERNTDFPQCEPCYPDKLRIQFADNGDPKKELTRLAVFIRLWQKLHTVAPCGGGPGCAVAPSPPCLVERGEPGWGARPHSKYTFSELADIANVLGLFESGGTVNPDFIRQLAAFQMLRDDFHLPLRDETDATPGVDDLRTHLLALWKGPSAPKWKWAIQELLFHIEHHARTRHHRAPREPEFLKLLADNLDEISRLAGFDDTVAERTWHALPTHTLRFAEVLSKIYASHFTVGEILYLFTADTELVGDDPFPLGDDDGAIEDPLDYPDEVDQFSLWRLRQKLLDVHVGDEEEERWTWPHIQASMREDFGYDPGAHDALGALGAHFFPRVLEHAGTTVAKRDTQYRTPLASTSAAMWNTPADGPFHYDTGASGGELFIELPLSDERVLHKLARIRQLTGVEIQAVRDLYYQPRAELAQFAFLFPDFAEAEKCAIEEPEETERWHYFRRHFARAHARAKLIAEHLAAHVHDATSGANDTGETHEHVPSRHAADRLAWRLLRDLLADENKAKTPWGDDSGTRPDVTWKPAP
ncbi:MAG TPA: hypothetical protein VNO21_20830, partial [Polyangiaceae bacterium]|nr:hypothetical protein [Polyangiaceae bacterium]